MGTSVPSWTFLAKYSAELNSHLLRSPQNVGFLSPKIQNEFACINGELIRKSIVQECNDPLSWSSCPVSQVGMVYEGVRICVVSVCANVYEWMMWV